MWVGALALHAYRRLPFFVTSANSVSFSTDHATSLLHLLKAYALKWIRIMEVILNCWEPAGWIKKLKEGGALHLSLNDTDYSWQAFGHRGNVTVRN